MHVAVRQMSLIQKLAVNDADQRCKTSREPDRQEQYNMLRLQ
jgi:hypothetical protein